MTSHRTPLKTCPCSACREQRACWDRRYRAWRQLLRWAPGGLRHGGGCFTCELARGCGGAFCERRTGHA
jgi:hypothetical protein